MSRTPQQKLSDKQEKETAKVYKGKQQPGSGSGWKHRQDVKSDRYLVEDKRTGKKSISITSQSWYQLRKEAILLDRIPLMDIELDGRHYTMLMRDDFIELTDPS